MSRSKKIELPSSGRAGMSLVRAERLVAKTRSRGARSSQGVVLLGFATVAGMIAYGVLDTVGKTSALAASEAAVLPATVVAAGDLGQQVDAVTPVEAVPTLAAADTTVPAPVVAAEAAPACIGEIEDMLVGLRSETEADGNWATQQEKVTKLVQSTLDCEGAGFRIAGSLELLGSGIADLKVHWDREGRVLDLAMIDRTDASTTEAPATDASSIEFVIR